MGEVRIIAGEHGSRRLRVPASAARPTTDRVRESLFSSLDSALGGFAGVRVLDAFAGSGALALEAMSRGAAFACLVDADAQASKVAESNARSLGYASAQVRVLREDALAHPRRLAAAGPYDLVLLDPPYATAPHGVRRMLEALAEAEALAPGALITYEHAADDAAAVEEAFRESGFAIRKSKRYGSAQVSTLIRDAHGDTADGA